MSQSPQEDEEPQQHARRQPEPDGQPGLGNAGAVRYGDVFDVGGALAGQPVAPEDAAMMQAAEEAVLRRTPQVGAAAAMQSAAARNARLGVVGSEEADDDDAVEHGVTVSEARVPGGRIVTEFVADQPVKQCFEADDDAATAGGGRGVPDGTKITIGEALEASAFSAGDQAMEPSDAEAIAAAEARAAGKDEAPPDGLAARARAAAEANALAERDEDKTRLRDVLADATVRICADKDVEREDAARVVAAEVRSDPDAAARPGGVASSVAAAARLNRGRQ